MSKKLYPETDIQNIANAIRALNGSTDTYTVSEMASAIALPENGYYLKQSASANPLTITDGQELNAQSCEVSFSPIQDLHGYQSPWIDSSEINNEPYLFRPVKNTATRIGNSLFDTLVGGTVAFNQLLNINGQIGMKSGTISIENNVLTFTATAKSTYQYINQNVQCLSGHKILFSVDITLSENETVGFGDGSTIYKTVSVSANTNTRINYIRNFSPERTAFYLYPARTEGLSIGGTMVVKNLLAFDLTQMFGSTIADYIYSLEQATAGSGVAYFRSLFPKDYYAYNAGQLMSVKALSHKMVGFNACDEIWELGAIDGSGLPTSSTTSIRLKNKIQVVPNSTYHFSRKNDSTKFLYFYTYTKSGTFSRYIGLINQASYDITLREGECYLWAYQLSNTSEPSDFCIHLKWDGERDGEYEAYSEQIYPLDSDLELRGIPKLDANNNLYYDGDTYESDGTVTRKYGIVDLGSLEWKIGNAEIGSFWSTLDILRGTNNLIAVGYTTKTSSTGTEDLNNMQIKSTINISAIAIRNNDYINATVAQFKAAMSGVYLVYELATPTTETADTFTNPQLVDNWGTEEYTDSREVQIPVGHESYQANICEISGRTAINVYQSATSTTTADTTYTTQFTGTVYGATGDMVSGNWEGEWGYIASYNGETLPAEWMSDRDAYVSGTTPTTGAEVAYVLATPTEIVTAPKTIPLSENTNNFWTDGDSVQVKYYSKSL